MKDAVNADALDEKDEDEEDDDNEKVVPVETDSYVNLRKKMVKRHETRTEGQQQENAKLCREFRRKQVRVPHIRLLLVRTGEKCQVLSYEAPSSIGGNKK